MQCMSGLPRCAPVVLVLLVLAGSAMSQRTRANTLQLVSFNLLDPAYAGPSDFPAAALPFSAPAIRTQRQITSVLTPLAATADAFMFQEISVSSPCLSNPSIIIPGQFGPISQAMAGLGYTCYHVAHRNNGTAQGTYWGNYFDYTSCTAFNAYVRSGNAICLKTASFLSGSIQFRDVELSTGTHLAIADATFRTGSGNTGVPVTLGSLHFDSDVQGNRNREVAELFATFPVGETRLKFFCGDYNAAWRTAAIQADYDNSGFVDALLDLADNFQRSDINVPTQPETNTYYNTPWIQGGIDHCLGEKARVSPLAQLFIADSTKYTIPGYTANGVLSNQLWIRLPQLQGNDLNSEARVVAAVQELGSDHFPIVTTWVL